MKIRRNRLILGWIISLAALVLLAACDPITGSQKETVETPIASVATGNYEEIQTVTLTCATSGAVIRYTLNGSTPNADSAQYTSPILISETTILKAIAVKPGMNNSALLTQAYTITLPSVSQAAMPAADPGAGDYTSAQSVALASATAGASIYYTLDGTTPTMASSVYASPIAIASTTTLKAIAVKSGLKDSPVLTAQYTITGASSYDAERTSDGKRYLTLAEAIADSKGSAEEPVEIAILRNIGAASNNYTIPADTHIQLVVATGSDFVITEPTADGDMFLIVGGSLIFGSDTASGTLTLQGTDNRCAGIENGGTLIMNDNVTITDFHFPVSVRYNSYFTMRGGRIENTDSPDDGGGVLAYRGTFRMEGGVIANNSGRVGGGVAVTYGGTFIFKAGTIYGSDNPEYANTVHTWGFNALGTFGGGERVIYDDGSPIPLLTDGGIKGFHTTLGPGTDNPPNETEGVDYVKITNVTPSGNLTGGVEQEFTVEVEYELASQGQSELSVGFNSYGLTSWQVLPESEGDGKTIVTRGKGAHTFNVRALTKNWGAEGDFFTIVVLWSPRVNGSSYGLASDKKILRFNGNGGGNTGGSIPDRRFLGAWSASSTWSGGHWDSTITISENEIVMKTVYDGHNINNKISGLTWTPYTLDNNDDSNHNGYRVTGASHEGSFKVFYLVLLDDNTFHGLHQSDGSSTAGNARWFEGHYVKSR